MLEKMEKAYETKKKKKKSKKPKHAMKGPKQLTSICFSMCALQVSLKGESFMY